MEPPARWWSATPNPSSDVIQMNQLCRVCGEPAAGFHFGAFTCEGCKSFFGRTYNNLSSVSECKNNGECVINKKNRTSCKACRLKKCILVGMSKSGSRYGRRSNWFKIHCLLQEQGGGPFLPPPGREEVRPPPHSPSWEKIDNNNTSPVERLNPMFGWAAAAGFPPLPIFPHPPPVFPHRPPVLALQYKREVASPSPAPDSLALLSSLGPVQEAPMDLSKGSAPEKTEPSLKPEIKPDLNDTKVPPSPLDLTYLKT